MKKGTKLLQSCPNCDYPYQPKDYIANSAVCRQCLSSAPKWEQQHNWFYNHRKWIVGATLLFCGVQFSYLTYSHWDILSKKDSTPTHYIKRYWTEIKQDKLLLILKSCLKKSDLKCQMIAYQKLHELHPEDAFYKKNYEARRKKINP